ncbi:ubiquinol-cytochrome c reductase cytochrome b subunit [Streptomyces olivoreticuli]|uniref:cytochrome bc1 complex cytochrome b subunit n=1 Tax=Streptomyces olivoreticuli TaxID=68246 RepID=UPI0026598EED|nr:ubiquinol-cytochrome c reductase cytochrome b subunit [Streptomyces olivoreticuli]WKK23537.1 ubiquinol-cytochrome c reductase cytochrome b subunit [Streptomyces olivoreticuli]
MLFRRRGETGAPRARAAAAGGFVAMDRRLPVAEAGRALLRKAFPDHWSYLLGELALYSFVVLVLTGSYLALFFDPGMTRSVYHGPYAPLRGLPMSQAYLSTLDLSFQVRGGLLIRQIHHWAALVFVAAAAVHMLRVFLTGAFRRPREANWLVGMTLFVLAMLEGFCGYSLPDDLLSGTGMRTANTIVLSIPVVGTYLSSFLWRGPFPGHVILPRLYIVHVLFVPGVLIALLTAHLLLVVYLKHTHWAERGRTNRNAVGQPMFPQFLTKSTGLFLMLFGLLAALGALAQVNPVWNYGPYRPDQVATDAQPDWYVGFLEGALRVMPPWETVLWGHTWMWNVLIPAVVLPGVLFTALYLYPFLEKWVTADGAEHHLSDRPRNRPTRTALGVAGIVFYAVLLAAGGNDVVAYSFRVSIDTLTWIFRAGVVLGPVVAFLVTKRMCLALQDHDRLTLAEGEESGEVEQSVHGGLAEGHRPLSARRGYRLMVREIPLPLPAGEGPVPRRQRLRTALSSWYYRDRVELPVTPEQRREIEERTAAPVEPGE